MRKINKVEQLFISLIANEICPGEISDDIKLNITEDSLEELFALATAHDFVPFVANVLFKNKIDIGDEWAEVYRSHLMMALFRHQQQAHELSRIDELFEKEEIPFIPLKGSIIKQLYTEPYLRTSCDIDVLVKKEDLEKAAAALTDKLNFENTFKGDHDWGFKTENGVYVELHYELIEKREKNKGINTHSWTSNCLENVWKTAINDGDKKFRFKMSDELFYFYHIAHMAKHFEGGGCGVKPIVDLYLINQKIKPDSDKCIKLFEDEGLDNFEKTMRELAGIWFSGKKAEGVLELVETFILTGGVYGNITNYVNIQKSKAGGRFKYIWSRIFLGYDFLSIQYPVLQKHRWLMPVCQVARWLRLIFKGKLGRSVNEFKQSADDKSPEENENTKALLNYLGII